MTTTTSPTPEAPTLAGNLLDERLLHYRSVATGERISATLPELFVALAQDAVRDFPALRPHQRHPWHAFLVQLAAIALHGADHTEPLASAAEWRSALLALTPDDADGAAWCLVSPVNRPAFMQAPEPSGSIGDWKNAYTAADELDMLVTSKNHDLKTRRMDAAEFENWVYALVSLQTQDGFPGNKNFGIARMNSGSGSRCGVGVVPNGQFGKRWLRDVNVLQQNRTKVLQRLDLKDAGGIALIWLVPWSGGDSLSFASLDPWFIEVCRRVRLTMHCKLTAYVTGSEVRRVSAEKLRGVTGDAWMPVDSTEAKVLTISRRGFDYKLAADLLFGTKLDKADAQMWRAGDDANGVYLIAQGVARGQSKTEGYHERRIPISRKVRQGLAMRQTDALAKLAAERIEAIAEVRKMLWGALTALFGNGAKDETGKDKDANDTVKDRANLFAQPFEAQCDAHFFPELNEEIEAEHDAPEAIRSQWLLALADRAEQVLHAAFVAGPRSSQLRYRAQSAALSRLRSAMRGSKLPALASALKTRAHQPTEETHELA